MYLSTDLPNGETLNVIRKQGQGGVFWRVAGIPGPEQRERGSWTMDFPTRSEALHFFEEYAARVRGLWG